MLQEFVKGKHIEGSETSKTTELSQNRYPEINVQESKEFVEVKEVKRPIEILKPDIETIKSESLESIKQNNIEKIQKSNEINEKIEYNRLTEKEIQELREKTHLSENAIQSIIVGEDGTYHLKCINEDMVGQFNEITGVKYIEKIVTDGSIQITVVVPEFSYVFEVSIPENLWIEGDNKIFKNCTEQIRDYLEKHPEMNYNFSDQQLAQIQKGLPRISGYTWHHTEVPGKMQLIDSKIHANTRHTGGNYIWCGGVR